MLVYADNETSPKHSKKDIKLDISDGDLQYIASSSAK